MIHDWLGQLVCLFNNTFCSIYVLSVLCTLSCVYATAYLSNNIMVTKWYWTHTPLFSPNLPDHQSMEQSQDGDYTHSHPEGQQVIKWYWRGCHGLWLAQPLQVSIFWQLPEGAPADPQGSSLVPHPVVSLLLQAEDVEKFPHALCFEKETKACYYIPRNNQFSACFKMKKD